MFQLMFAIITAGADLRRDRRPHEVRCLDRSSSRSGRRSSTSRSRTGCSTSTASRPASVGGWIANDAGRARLRRRHGGPHQRRCRRPRAGHRARQARRLAARARCARTTCRSCCSAPACCGSAGSASTPARRSPPTAWPRVAFVNTHGRHGGGAARLDPRGADPRRQAHHARRRLRRRRRPGRDHPGRAASSPRWARSLLGLVAGARLRARRRPEVPLRLRRLARRRRRAPRRRHRRLPADRLLRHHERQPGSAPTACSTAAASTQLGKQAVARARGARSTRSSSPSSSGCIIKKTIGFRVADEDEVEGIDVTSTPRSRTTSPRCAASAVGHAASGRRDPAAAAHVPAHASKES